LGNFQHSKRLILESRNFTMMMMMMMNDDYDYGGDDAAAVAATTTNITKLLLLTVTRNIFILQAIKQFSLEYNSRYARAQHVNP
jgi:hypothetical protein